MSHVVPDLIQKILKGQYPLRILGDGNQIRHYTYGEDLAEGIYKSLISENSINEDFNISTPTATSVLELAQVIWKNINPDKPFRYNVDIPYEYDVQKRIPNVEKAKKILNFEAKIHLEESVNEVINYLKNK